MVLPPRLLAVLLVMTQTLPLATHICAFHIVVQTAPFNTIVQQLALDHNQALPLMLVLQLEHKVLHNRNPVYMQKPFLPTLHTTGPIAFIILLHRTMMNPSFKHFYNVMLPHQLLPQLLPLRHALLPHLHKELSPSHGALKRVINMLIKLPPYLLAQFGACPKRP